jgi:hypothetical protein
MKVVFSRKGFDSGAGGFPSPIIEGKPISLPIPTQRRSATTYGDLGLGDIVEQLTKGRLTRKSLCHYDPMFESDHCAFGQTGAAQTHLSKNGVAVGDVFLSLDSLRMRTVMTVITASSATSKCKA